MSAPLEGFTRGPLTVGQRSATTYTVQAEIDGKRVTIAACYGWGFDREGVARDRDRVDAKANAELFAKAPIMFDVLCEIRAWLMAPDLSDESLNHFRRLVREACEEPARREVYYVISHIDRPDHFWTASHTGPGWSTREHAYRYSASARETVKLPARGCWVRVEG